MAYLCQKVKDMSTEKEKEAIKEATTNAIIALEGCKYF